MTTLHAEDGDALWLRYPALTQAQAAPWRALATELVASADTPLQQTAREELQRGLAGMLGAAPPLAATVDRAGALVLGTAATPAIARLRLDTHDLGEEGYLIRSVVIDGHPTTVLVGGGERGVLYAAFGFLRLLQTGQMPTVLHLRDAPRVQLRMLDHWDNLDGFVERGYAGASLWNWRAPAASNPER
ncbi:alpha-glucuronidase family glycosyl hydrolase [Xanthomonas sp. MUS 060]|uniref:alpha-glucuronidase family glycosyl hydrolase n=1 Tax=Xanthomonas sp. MUS 060 TaxID=1588031 RepID=UPI0005F2A350|nr:alpha-glucuronidase family glycosyl hydrolase [Xanthomonas sp. MUS 060]